MIEFNDYIDELDHLRKENSDLKTKIAKADDALASTELPCECDDGISECYCLQYDLREQITKARQALA